MAYSINKNNSYQKNGSSYKISSTPNRPQWATQVWNHFLALNTQLSTLNRFPEWSPEAIEESKKWSDDGQTPTPWRFIAEKTDNMPPDGYSDSEINSEGYYIPDINAGSSNPRRLWGNNTPMIDKGFHRLIGSEKYTNYHNQYDLYDYVPYDSQTETGGTYVPAQNAVITETAQEVRDYYWNTFGYSTDGKGDNTSNWLYPIWGGDPQGTINRAGSSEYIEFVSDSNNLIDSNSLKIDVENIRIDNEGFIVNDDEYGIFNCGDRAQNILNRTQYFENNTTNHKYFYKSDKLCIVSKNDNFTNITIEGANDSLNQIMALKKPLIYTKNYKKIDIRGRYDDNFPFPILRGKTELSIGNYTINQNWINFQDSVPIRRANILFGNIGLSQFYNNLPVSFENITTSIGRSAYTVTSLTPTFYADFKNCPNLENIGIIYSKMLRIINCPKLVRIAIINVVDLGENEELQLDINPSTGRVDNINIDNIEALELMNCNFSQATVDAIIKTFHHASQNLERNNLFLRLDNRVDNSEGGQGTNKANQPPSQSVIDNEIADLENLYNSIVITAQ